MVYGRAREDAEGALMARLRLRADTLSGLVEFDVDRFELEVPLAAMPEYAQVGSGAYFVVYDNEGEVFLASPSLGEDALPTPEPWQEDGLRVRDLDDGPCGQRCVLVCIDFVVRLETERAGPGVRSNDASDDESGAWSLPEAERRFQVQVALDRSEVDRDLAGLAAFLAVAGALTVGVALFGGAVLARRIVRPIRTMTEAARSLTPEDADRRLDAGHVVSELTSLATTVNSAFDRLADALRHQRRFTADASHELRTPAAILLSNAELLLRRERTAEAYREGLERQHATAKRMAGLIDGLLTLARADAGRESLERWPVDLADVVHTVCDEHAPMAAERGVHLHCDGRPGTEIEGDPGRLAQLVGNLVSNALKYAPRGGRVDVLTRRDGDEVVLEVADDGPGIAAEHHDHLFERFYRVDPERSGACSGTGLGLSIVAWIADAHGGRVAVDSEPGKGSRFIVTFPCPAVAPVDAAAIGA